MNEGYDFVPLPGEVHRIVRQNNQHDIRMSNYFQALIDVEFDANEPIHIGSGSRALQNEKVVREAARIEGRPGIPGSSLRGVLRARLEAITKSCCISGAPADRRLDKGLPSQTYPDYQVQFDPKIAQQVVFRQCQGGELCMACSIFGHMGTRSRLSVQDLSSPKATSFATKLMPQLFSPRPHHLGEKRTTVEENKKLIINDLRGRKFHENGGPAPTGKKELVEVIPEGTTLTGRLSFSNATSEEMGALLAILGENPLSYIKIGSAKSHGFGALVPVGATIKLRQAGSLSVANEKQKAAWRRDFQQSKDRWESGEQKLLDMYPLGGEE
jgi:CRISPR/Cas system CSM-associated protein Csm3 (group 7 of RAMP superfamily)